MKDVYQRHEKLKKVSKQIRKILRKNNILISNYKGSVFLYDHRIVENNCFSIVRRELISEKALVSEEFGRTGFIKINNQIDKKIDKENPFEDVPF